MARMKAVSRSSKGAEETLVIMWGAAWAQVKMSDGINGLVANKEQSFDHTSPSTGNEQLRPASVAYKFGCVNRNTDENPPKV